jgi:hypothetical protein
MSYHPVTSDAALKNAGRVLNQKPLAWQQVPAGERPAGWEALHNYVHPGGVTLHLAIFWTSNVSDADDPIPAYFAEAKRLLVAHGLDLTAYPAPHKSPETTLQFNKDVYLFDQIKELRNMAHKAFPGNEVPRLPVIVCPFRQSLVDDEIATGMAIRNSPSTPSGWNLEFILINSQIKSPDNVTLLHEIGHAAGLVHEGAVIKNADVLNVMQYYDPKATVLPGRDGLKPNQVKRLATAYFATSPKKAK